MFASGNVCRTPSPVGSLFHPEPSAHAKGLEGALYSGKSVGK